MKNVALSEACPQSDAEYFECPSREQMLTSLGLETLLERAEDGYSGETLVIVHDPDDGRVGFLSYFWGSCSGCDSVYGASSYEDAEEIRSGLRESINWAKSRAELRAWIDTPAWDLAHEFNDSAKECKRLALEMLPALCVVHDDCKGNEALAAECFRSRT